MVTNSLSADKPIRGGGLKSRTSLILRYSDKFEELCAYYMSIGMSYEEYWNGDCCKTKYYRRMYEIKKQRTNYDLWLQGAYIYEALRDCYPLFNPLSKRKEPYPYRDSPYPLNEIEMKKQEAIKKRRKMEQDKAAVQKFVEKFNEQFKRRNNEGVVDYGN